MAEAATQKFEDIRYDRQRTVIYIGELALRDEDLGINDPLTHLEQYARRGNEALVGIREDLDTLILERLPDPFENSVEFVYAEGDFISVKDRVSLKKITAENERILTEEAKKNSKLNEELFRALIEAQEPYKVEEWFNVAPIGGVYITESPPIGTQDFATTRLHFKTAANAMSEHIVSLHNPSLPVFNQLRAQHNVDQPPAQTKMELLAAGYQLQLLPAQTPKQFVEAYVDSYDALLRQADPANSHYSYGVVGLAKHKILDNYQKVRQSSQLKEIYIDALAAFKDSGGVAGEKLVNLSANLGLEHSFHPGQRLTIDNMRATMRGAIQTIVSTLDRASVAQLEELEASNLPDNLYGMAAYYGLEARAQGQVYDSGCPTTDRSVNNTEQAVLTNGYHLSTLLGEMFKDFGTSKIGVCRTANCLSRGFSKKPERTIVGGCDFCKDCHRMFKLKKDPAEEHAKERQKIMAKKQAKTA